jgi:hypothetical protein
MGVGGSSANSLPAASDETPPNPNPSPPRASLAGGGEHIDRMSGLTRNKIPFLKVNELQERRFPMPYSRPYRRFYLTPPAVPTFVISVLLAIVALFAVYGHLTVLHGVSGFTILLIAYVVLLIGNLLRGV